MSPSVKKLFYKSGNTAVRVLKFIDQDHFTTFNELFSDRDTPIQNIDSDLQANLSPYYQMVEESRFFL